MEETIKALQYYVVGRPEHVALEIWAKGVYPSLDMRSGGFFFRRTLYTHFVYGDHNIDLPRYVEVKCKDIINSYA